MRQFLCIVKCRLENLPIATCGFSFNRVAKFGDAEMYNPLYIDSWQDATLLKGTDNSISKMSVIQDPDGEYLK